jgi:hypothetical protein
VPEPAAIRGYAAIATLNVAAYPLAGSPDTVAISDGRLSAKMLSPQFDVGFDPREAYIVVPDVFARPMYPRAKLASLATACS